MQLFPITQLLVDAGLALPDLHVLKPNHDNYSALLLQPNGDIEADTNGVRNADQELAGKQFASFLVDAVTDQAALAITPEYSMPWMVFEDCLRKGVGPAPGSLWVLGCESTTLNQLGVFKERVSDLATVLYENLEPQPGRFVDPVLYVFTTKSKQDGGKLKLAIVVQFKTSPMGDKGHFEINGLQTGTRLYFFGDGTTQLRLATIICSDAFALLDEQASAIYDRTLIIHIQLNPKPRQTQYRQYRSRLMQFGGDQTELLCLNWAKNVCELSDGKRKCWNNISGTGWYLRPDKFDRDDRVLTDNHKRGLYYTSLNDPRCHALFFTYEAAVFHVVASKVAHIGVQASISRRRGPQLKSTRFWDSKTARWVDATNVDDGFSTIAHESGDAEHDLKSMVATNPFAAERALALAAGRVRDYEWYNLSELDSCTITSSEVVNRITVCHDTDIDATQFRTRRLKTAHRLMTALKTKLPAALADLSTGFSLDWTPQSPHTNITSSNGRRATAIYLGDEYNGETACTVAAIAADHIGKWETTPDAIIEGRQRLHVWYRDHNGNDVTCDPNRYVHFDESHTESPVDFTRSK